jgi:hypothetical protein
MVKLSLKWREGAAAKTLANERDLQAAVEDVAGEAMAAGRLHLVEFQAENGNSLSIALGGAETVLIFGCPENDPPYRTLRGPEDTLEPILECHSLGVHRVDVPRRFVIPADQGVSGLKSFAATGEQPEGSGWEET